MKTKVFSDFKFWKSNITYKIKKKAVEKEIPENQEITKEVSQMLL